MIFASKRVKMNKDKELILIEKVRSGDTSCYRDLVDAYGENIFTLIYKMTGNREDAEELAQDVFVKAFFSLKKFRGESSFSTWLYRIAYNLTISSLRKKKKLLFSQREVEKEFVADESEEDVFLKKICEKEYELLENAINRLDTIDKFLMMAFYKQEKSLSELADITGLSLSNVKTRLFRARTKIKTELK
jgi:RNA polymerase sigma-70 factor, ECF subfamily